MLLVLPGMALFAESASVSSEALLIFGAHLGLRAGGCVLRACSPPSRHGAELGRSPPAAKPRTAAQTAVSYTNAASTSTCTACTLATPTSATSDASDASATSTATPSAPGGKAIGGPPASLSTSPTAHEVAARVRRARDSNLSKRDIWAPDTTPPAQHGATSTLLLVGIVPLHRRESLRRSVARKRMRPSGVRVLKRVVLHGSAIAAVLGYASLMGEVLHQLEFVAEIDTAIERVVHVNDVRDGMDIGMPLE